MKNIEFLTDPTEGDLRIGGGLPGFGGVIPATTVDLPIEPTPFGVVRLKNRMLTPVAELFIACMRDIVKLLARSR